MTLALALGVAILFGCGVRLMLEQDVVRIAAGTILVSNAANLFLIAGRLTSGPAPVLPEAAKHASDPVVQAMVLTSVVITLGFTAVLLAIVHRIYRAYHTLDTAEIAKKDPAEKER